MRSKNIIKVQNEFWVKTRMQNQKEENKMRNEK